MVPDKGGPRRPEDLLEWFTVSYRTLYIIAGVVIVLAAGGGYFYYTRYGSPPPLPPAPPPTSTSARFNSLEGSVQVKAAGTLQWVNADNKNMVLNENDLVRTGPGAAAEIRFSDGTIFHMRPDSLIKIEETSVDPTSKQRRTTTRISSGEVNFATGSVPGSAARILTPTVETTTRGSAEGNIQVQESGQTTTRLFQGTAVAQTRTGERIVLNPNEGVVVDAGGKAGQKMSLPGVPTLLAPPNQSEIAYPDIARATTLLAWQAVGGASAYHLVLDFSANFARPVVDRKDWRKGSYELTGLEVGTYFWKVAALDKDGGEGQFSDSSRFTVTRSAVPPPPLVIDTLEPRGNVLQVKGRTEPGASLTVNGQRVDVQTDGSFNEFITFEGGKQMVVIRATGVGGGVSELKRPVVVPD